MSNNSGIELRAAVSFEVDAAKAAAAKSAAEGIAASANKAADGVKNIKPTNELDSWLKVNKASAEKSFSAINAATAATEGGVRGVGEAVKNVAGQFPLLQAAMGPIGLLIAAFASWKKVVDLVKEAHDRLATMLRVIALGNIEAQIRSTASAYDQQRSAIDRAADARQRLSDIEQAKDDAALRAQLAQIELSRAQDKATVSPDDSIGTRKIDLQYDQQRAALEVSAAQRKSERETTSLAAQLSDVLDKRKTAMAAIAQLEREYYDLSGKKVDLIQGAGDSSKKWEKASPEIADIDKLLADTFEKIKAAYQAKADSETPIMELKGKREVAETDRRTAAVNDQTKQTQAYVTGSGIDRDENKQLDDMFEQLNTVASDGSALMRNWIRNQIAAKEKENALNAAFMQQMIDLATANAKKIQDATARARLQ